MTGCTGLFGGEAPRLVVAGIADVAGALARAGRDKLIVPPGKEAASVASLPFAGFRLSAECQSGLNRLGLHCVGDLLKQPRGPLARRFGRTLMDTLDALTGDRPRSLIPSRPPPEFMEDVNLLEPITTRPAIDTAVDALLERLCHQTETAGQRVRAVTLRAFRVDRDVREITLGTGLHTRTPDHLRRLFAHELDRLEPDLGFERMTLEAGITNAMEPAQKSMATTGADTASRDEALAQLIDQLSQALSVWRPAPAESHWPERSRDQVDAFDVVAERPPSSPLTAPVRLLKRPAPLMVLAETPEGRRCVSGWMALSMMSPALMGRRGSSRNGGRIPSAKPVGITTGCNLSRARGYGSYGLQPSAPTGRRDGFFTGISRGDGGRPRPCGHRHL